MGIYPQPNAWLCGPFALKHALIALGMFENEWVIARAAGSNPAGTDERELARAARQFDCSVRLVRVHDSDEARQELVYHLDHGAPVLLCIEQWDHWVTAMHHEDGLFVLFDSRGPHVVRIMTWDELCPKWEYKGADGSLLYDLHPVVARIRARRSHARFSIARARWLAQPPNTGLARQWSDYGRLLLAFGEPGSAENHDLFARPITEVLLELEGQLWSTARGRLRKRPAGEAVRILERLRFVAETYDLHILQSREADLAEAARDFVMTRARAGRKLEP